MSTSAYWSGCTTRSSCHYRTFFGMPDPTRCGICSVSLFAPLARLYVFSVYLWRTAAPYFDMSASVGIQIDLSSFTAEYRVRAVTDVEIADKIIWNNNIRLSANDKCNRTPQNYHVVMMHVKLTCVPVFLTLIRAVDEIGRAGCRERL